MPESLVPYLGDLPEWLSAAAAFISVSQARSSRRSAAIAEGALRDAGLPPREAAERIAADPRLEEIVASVLAQTVRSALDEKLRLLRRLLGAALTETGTQVDQLHFITRAVERLDPPHLIALRLIENPGTTPATLTSSISAVTGSDLQERWPGGAGVYVPVLAALEAEGLIEQSPGIAPIQPIKQWTMTELGWRLLNYLRDSDSIDLADIEQ